MIPKRAGAIVQVAQSAPGRNLGNTKNGLEKNQIKKPAAAGLYLEENSIENISVKNNISVILNNKDTEFAILIIEVKNTTVFPQRFIMFLKPFAIGYCEVIHSLSPLLKFLRL